MTEVTRTRKLQIRKAPSLENLHKITVDGHETIENRIGNTVATNQIPEHVEL